jgi:hypothetical protein
MALKLTANYSKRLGLPGFSSHQFSISVEAELNNTDDVQAEASRLYSKLQSAVDLEIQNTGFVPEEGYGASAPKHNGGSHNGTNGNANGTSNGNGGWKCSQKQKDLILKLMDEHNLQKGDLQSIALEMFGTSEVSALNRLQASGLIDRIIDQYGNNVPRRGTTPAGRQYQGRSR